jgi:hypothetical protein
MCLESLSVPLLPNAPYLMNLLLLVTSTFMLITPQIFMRLSSYPSWHFQTFNNMSWFLRTIVTIHWISSSLPVNLDFHQSLTSLLPRRLTISLFYHQYSFNHLLLKLLFSIHSVASGQSTSVSSATILPIQL